VIRSSLPGLATNTQTAPRRPRHRSDGRRRRSSRVPQLV